MTWQGSDREGLWLCLPFRSIPGRSGESPRGTGRGWWPCEWDTWLRDAGLGAAQSSSAWERGGLGAQQAALEAPLRANGAN